MVLGSRLRLGSGGGWEWGWGAGGRLRNVVGRGRRADGLMGVPSLQVAWGSCCLSPGPVWLCPPPPSLLLVCSPGQEALRLSNTPCLQCSRSTGVFTPGSTFFHLLSNLFPRVRTPSRSRSRYPVQPPNPASRPFPVEGSSSLPLPGPSRGLTGAEVNGTTAPPAFWTDASKGSPSSLWAPHFSPSPGLLVDPLLIKPVLPWGWGSCHPHVLFCWLLCHADVCCPHGKAALP